MITLILRQHLGVVCGVPYFDGWKWLQTYEGTTIIDEAEFYLGKQKLLGFFSFLVGLIMV